MFYLGRILFLSLLSTVHCLPVGNSPETQCQTLHHGLCVSSEGVADSCSVVAGTGLCTGSHQVCCVPRQQTREHTSPQPSSRWHPNCGVNKYNNIRNSASRKVRRSKRVIGGQEASVGQIPWQAAIVIEGTVKCGGALITGRYVLTAAHCVECAQESGNGCNLVLTHEVMLGAHSVSVPNPNTRIIFVEKAYIHDDYDPTTLANDIAILQLNRDISEDIIANEDINTVCAPDASMDYTGMTCYMSGWGKTGYPLGASSDTLQYVDLPVVNQPTCCTQHCGTCNGDCTVFDHNICAGYEQGGKDACSGDSGGALVCSVDNLYHVVGINSWGDGCARENSPGVYVSVASFLDWIDQVLNNS